MTLIKRYPNRKLYDTEAKRYITLEQLADLIRTGADVQVIDHETGEDLTSITLTQIVLEQQKQDAGFLPRSLLTNLIRTGGSAWEQMRHSLQSGLDAAGQIRSVPWKPSAELEEHVDALVDRGRLSVEQAQEVLRLDERWSATLEQLNVPTRRDVQQLRNQLAALNEKLDELLADDSPPDGAA